MKNVYFVLLSLLCVFYVVHEVRKKKFSIKESFWWFFASLLMLILSIFPYSIDNIAKFLNISYPPSLLFVFCIIFLLFINFRSSKNISLHQEKIIELAQRLALLEDRVKEIDKKGKK